MSMLTPHEVATAMRISVQTVRRLIGDGTLPAVKVGRQARIDATALARFLQQSTTQKPQNQN